MQNPSEAADLSTGRDAQDLGSHIAGSGMASAAAAATASMRNLYASGYDADDTDEESGYINGAPPQKEESSKNKNTSSNGTTTGVPGLACNMNRTTGQRPPAFVGATVTIVGDRLYVFGGCRVGETRTNLSNELFELDLVHRHWNKIQARGILPSPRYFHTVCALGDTKLVCYGGVASARQQQTSSAPQEPVTSDPNLVVTSDIHIYEIGTETWSAIPVKNAPRPRYAHCAAISPSTTVFTSSAAPLSAIRHNPASGQPNQGTIGHDIDGTGGAEMFVVGGQEGKNEYTFDYHVFNFRSLQWTRSGKFPEPLGTYRGVVVPTAGLTESEIGTGNGNPANHNQLTDNTPNRGSPLCIYGNYEFNALKLRLKLRWPDDTISEVTMPSQKQPPGLRFPTGDVINGHLIISGTLMTAKKTEYVFWALNLRTLKWACLDALDSLLKVGAWNQGVLWRKRNSYVVLGHRGRDLHDDYKKRRTSFSNFAVINLETFGIFERTGTGPLQGGLSLTRPRQYRWQSNAEANLGMQLAGSLELSDLDFLSVDGQRIPVNSFLIRQRWGPYFDKLLREGETRPETSETTTLRPSVASNASRHSTITITPSVRTVLSSTPTLTPSVARASSVGSNSSRRREQGPLKPLRSRLLYLPHTHITVRALVHYLYTGSLPPISHPLGSPSVLCSLLQIARPYRVNGLLEALIENLHESFTFRNTAIIFNAAAMAAGGGEAIASVGDVLAPGRKKGFSAATQDNLNVQKPFRRNTVPEGSEESEGNELYQNSSANSSTSSLADLGHLEEAEIWTGKLSAVIGLQKRGLRGLMEDRIAREEERIRELMRADSAVSEVHPGIGLPNGHASQDFA